MHRAIFILLITVAFFTFTGNASLLQAQPSVIEGSVVDTETNQPLQGAHIFLSGTRLGTYTNKSGQFALRNIPTGSYRIIITMIGYERKVFRLDIVDGDRRNLNLRLNPVVYEMEDLMVDHRGKRWRKNLKRFHELFIGESANADSVVILNPEVLRFDSNFWGRLEAEAHKPLEIVNKSLGYHITYYLFEFKHVGGTTFWDGEPLFAEMTPSDPLQQILWDYNRFKAFRGSMRHFWLAVLDDRVDEEGFSIYKIWDPAFPGDRERRFTVTPEDIVRPGHKEFLKEVRFSGSLEIIYKHEPEELRYLDWARVLDRGPRAIQVSWLELDERSVTIDESGEVVQPYGALQSGYLGFERLADLTPRGYRPEGFWSQASSIRLPE
jgi:hypothetical protein